ncbi:MAG TPA: hypothetical protein VER33_05740 [Polyangiaceae bacterium]|nr:hypothetical protein [Polyangiaceae bacterium]
MTLIDENAFGLLVAFFDVEDAEYTLDRDDFVERFMAFRNVTLAHAADLPLGAGATALDLGHALYFEVADGEQAADPVHWLRSLRKELQAHGFSVTAVLSHGGRWVDEHAPAPAEVEVLASTTLLRASYPSEPLRRALYAETATHAGEASEGWGAGLYVDTEAVEALGKALKNAPTPLAIAGATFYRLGS